VLNFQGKLEKLKKINLERNSSQLFSKIFFSEDFHRKVTTVACPYVNKSGSVNIALEMG
jgi:hypothetical protein